MCKVRSDGYAKRFGVLPEAGALCVSSARAGGGAWKPAFLPRPFSRSTTSTGKTTEEIETAIRQMVDKAITSDKIVDIFEAAGYFNFVGRISMQVLTDRLKKVSEPE